MPSIFHSLLWKVGERISVQGLGIIVQIILARLLMPEDFACLAIISAVINYLGLFVQSGLSVAVVQKKELTPKDVSTLTTISLGMALVMYVVLYVAAPYISKYYNLEDILWPIRVMGLSLFLFAFNSIQTGLLQRKMMFRTIFFRTCVASTLSSIIGIALAYFGLGIWALIAYSMSNILFIVIFMNMMPELRLKFGFSLKSAKELYSFSLKILGTSLISSGGDTVRTLVIGKHYSRNQLAFFDRGLSYSGMVTQVVNTSISAVVLPVFSRKQEDIGELKQSVRRFVRMSAFVMLPTLVMVALLAKPLVLIVLSEKWLPCAIFLSLFCLLRIPGVITSCDKQVYYALGKSNIGLYYEALLLGSNILSLIIMLPHGIMAVAICFTVIEYIGNTALFFVSSYVYGYTIKERFVDLAKPMFNTVIMALVAFLPTFIINAVWPLLLVQLTVSVVSYISMAHLTKDESMIELLNKIKRIL